MALQDIAHRLIADLVPQISQRPDDTVITPVMVLLRHANDGSSSRFSAARLAPNKLSNAPIYDLCGQLDHSR